MMRYETDIKQTEKSTAYNKETDYVILPDLITFELMVFSRGKQRIVI